MDTSGTNLGQKPATRPDVYSKDELGAILKFGASTIFKSDADQSKKLEEMDLDDIINRAEAYETATAPTGTSLGGDEFLQQFAAVQDIKTDMASWEDIIPLEDRERIERERKEKVQESQVLDSSRRKAVTSYGLEESGSRESSPEAGTKKKKPAGKQKTKDQRAVELSERDLRTLIRGIERFGDIRHRYDAIVRDARLTGKNRAVIQKTADELLATCRRALEEHQESLRAKQAAGEEISAAIRGKAVLVDFHSVSKVNADTVISRAENLKILHDRECIAFKRRIDFFPDSIIDLLSRRTSWIEGPDTMATSF
jgi:chromodomain-helicase-DNA-binding protein 1